ncbi:hypothetical protein CRYUN_Cryun22dG0078400 [Craigia yunnanensis]
MQKELNRCKEMLEESSRCQLQLKEQALKREKVASLLRRVESLDLIEGQWLQMLKELERYKERLDEASRCQTYLEEQALQMESESREKLREVCDALDTAKSKLAEERERTASLMKRVEPLDHIEEQCLKTHEELKRYNEILGEASKSQCRLEEQELRKELEASLLAQVQVGETIKQEKDDQEKEGRIVNLWKQILSLEQELKTRELEVVISVEENILQIKREHDKILEDFKKEMWLLEEESLRRELKGAAFARIGAERKFVHEKENLLHLVKVKDHRIDGLMQEKIASAEILAKLEIEQKKLIILEFEDDIHNIQEKLLSQEKSLSESKQLALTVEVELEAKHLEMKNLTDQMGARLRTSEALVDELKSEKKNVLKDIMKLSTEREILFGFIGA